MGRAPGPRGLGAGHAARPEGLGGPGPQARRDVAAGLRRTRGDAGGTSGGGDGDDARCRRVHRTSSTVPRGTPLRVRKPGSEASAPADAHDPSGAVAGN